MFHMLDTSHSDTLTRAEVVTMVSQLELELSDEDIDNAMHVMDPDHDGEVTYEECEPGLAHVHRGGSSYQKP